MKEVELPDGTIAEFPDDMPDADIAKVLSGQFSPKKQATKAQKEMVKPVNRLARGAMDPFSGMAQMLYNAVPESVQNLGTKADQWLFENTGGFLGADRPFNEKLLAEEQAYQQARQATGQEGIDGYRLGGQIVSDTALAGMVPQQKAASALQLTRQNAAMGAGLGMTQPVFDPEADFWTEKGKQAAIGGAGATIATPIAAGAARLIKPKASTDPHIQTLMREGVIPSPGQIMGGGMRATEDKLRSLPVMGDLIQSGHRKSLAELNRAAYNRALRPIGKSAKGFPVGREGVARVKQELSKAYDDLLPKMSFSVDDAFAKDLNKIQAMVKSLPEDAQRRFNRALNDQFSKMTPQGKMTGETFKQATSELNRLAKKYRSDPSVDVRDVGDALGEVVSSMRNTLKRVNPDFKKQLDAIDKGYANYAIIRDAASRQGAEGGFSIAQLTQAVRAADKSVGKGNTATGKALMQDLSDAGRSVLSQTVPNSGTVDRTLLNAGALGSGAINPVIPAGLVAGGLPYLPGVRNVVAQAMTQRPEWAGLLANPIRRSAPIVAPPLMLQE